MPDKKRGGGPQTPEGKLRSRQNATRHGMRSKSLVILAGETEEEYEATRLGWLTEYEPEGYHEVRLVEQLILDDWLLKRANRRLLETEAAITGADETNPADWTAEQEHKVELMERYKTTAERAFYRALNAVEQFRKDILREKALYSKMLQKKDQQIEDLEKELGARPPKRDLKAEANCDGPKTRAEETFQGQRSKKRQRRSRFSISGRRLKWQVTAKRLRRFILRTRF